MCIRDTVAEDNPDAAASVINMKKEINRVSNSTAAHEAQRLVANEPHRAEAYRSRASSRLHTSVSMARAGRSEFAVTNNFWILASRTFMSDLRL